MTKLEVQQRVLKNGKLLDLDLFEWDEKTRTFSSVEACLVIDFSGVDYCTFNTGSDCTFNTGYGCTFKTSYRCTFNTGSDCTFNTGYSCTFNTGYSCTFNTGDGCTFKTSSDCTFNFYSHAFIKNNANNCVAIARWQCDVTVYQLNDYKTNEDSLIKFDMMDVIIKPYVDVKLVDEYQMIIKSTKKLGEFEISKTIYINDYFSDADKIVYVAEKDGLYAHGDTIREAIADVQFKFMQSKDVQTHINRVKECGLVTPYDYRLITGACREGTQRFLNSNGLTWEDSMPIEDVKKIIAGQYGSEKFYKCFE